MRAADVARLTLAAGVVAYESAAPPGDLLPEHVDPFFRVAALFGR